MNEIWVVRPNHSAEGEPAERTRLRAPWTLTFQIPPHAWAAALCDLWVLGLSVYSNVPQNSQHEWNDTPAMQKEPTTMNDLRHFMYAASASYGHDGIHINHDIIRG